MDVSVELIAIVLSTAILELSFVGAFVGGRAWLIRHDAKMERSCARITRVEPSLGERVTALEREVIEVKVALAHMKRQPRELTPIR